jgi:hypothetical protein
MINRRGGRRRKMEGSKKWICGGNKMPCNYKCELYLNSQNNNNQKIKIPSNGYC